MDAYVILRALLDVALVAIAGAAFVWSAKALRDIKALLILFNKHDQQLTIYRNMVLKAYERSQKTTKTGKVLEFVKKDGEEK